MSQYPPQYPQYPQQNPQYGPPGGYPPGQPPYGGGPMQPGMMPGPGGYPQSVPMSGAAITALVTGVLLCIPWLTGLVALICGMVGMGSTKNGARRGRGMAVTGVILGIINLLGWSGLVWFGLVQVDKQKEVARTFVQDMSKGDVISAAKQCHSTMSPLTLGKDAMVMRQWGQMKQIDFESGFSLQSSTTSGSKGELTANVTFQDGKQRKFVFDFTMENSRWVIIKYEGK